MCKFAVISTFRFNILKKRVNLIRNFQYLLKTVVTLSEIVIVSIKINSIAEKFCCTRI